MKCYRLDYYTAFEGCAVEWHPSEESAAQSLARHRREAGSIVEPASIRKVDIPTTKRALLRWLNTYLVRDNG